MTICEIAKTHNGRRFRRKGWGFWWSFNGGCLYVGGVTAVCGLSHFTADDWEFEPQPMGFVEMVRTLAGDAKLKAIRSCWGQESQCWIEYAHGALRFAGDHLRLSVGLADAEATDWIVEAR